MLPCVFLSKADSLKSNIFENNNIKKSNDKVFSNLNSINDKNIQRRHSLDHRNVEKHSVLNLLGSIKPNILQKQDLQNDCENEEYPIQRSKLLKI